jgi:hypothetical protein
MNMISTGAFLPETGGTDDLGAISKKFAQVWERKNAKAAKAGGVSLMALSLAACGSDDATTTTATTTTTTTTTTTPTVTALTTALTVGVDIVTGTTAADTITGARVDSVQTWNAADTIDGGAGIDNFSATVAANVTPASGGFTNVENVTVTVTGGGTVDFSSATASFITGVTSLSSVGSSNATIFSDMTSNPTMTVNNSAVDHTFSMNDSVLTGAADTVTLNLVGMTGNVMIGTNADVDGDYETLIINSSGAASDLGDGDVGATGANTIGGDATLIDIGATAALDLGTTAGFAKITSFDASDSTAGVTAVFANKADTTTSATAVSIKGGAGADVFDVSALTAANHGAVTIAMGAGNDTVTLAGGGASDFTITGGEGTGDKVSISVVSSLALHGKLAGFEELISTDVIANAATTTLDLQNFVNNDFTTVNFNGTLATATTNAVTDVFAITNAKDSVTGLKLNALDVSDASITFARLTDGTANALTITATAASAAGSVAANDEETVTINNAAGAIDYTAVSATDMTSLTLIGDEQMDLGTVTATKLATVDASALEDSDGANGDFIADLSTSVVNMTLTGNASATHGGDLQVTTGGGNDTVSGTKQADTITTGAGGDTIDGGKGADIITGGTGADSMTGGAGADIFNFDAAFGADSITDFTAGTSGDVLDFQAFGSVTTAVTLGAIALTNNKVTVVDETTTNDTATEVDALFTALTDATASTSTTYTNIYVAVGASNTASIYDVTTVDNSGNNGLAVTVVELGTIDLGSTAWTSLTTANFDL